MALEEIRQMPARQVINPLFSFLHHGDERAKWAAVQAMGAVVAQLAEQDMEAARVVLRRLMWNLNDESGGIGWGSPEAMGEILARSKALAEEYAPILLSYTRLNGNYLEHELLQRGLLWGIGRLARTRPGFLENASPHLTPYLRSKDPTVRALAAKIMGLLGIEGARPDLERLTGDLSEVSFWDDGRRFKGRVKEVAEGALAKLSSVH
jgi:hypothetical protein